MPIERANAAWELLKELVRIDNTNPPGNERAACDLLARRLSRHSPRLLEGAPGRGNLVLRLGGGGKGLLLAAHLDTVPAGDDWRHPAFDASEEGGYLYGRGTLDMKHFAAMSAVIFEEASIRKLKRDLAVAFVAEEETGGSLGSGFLASKHPELVRAEAMLGEGGGFYQYLGAFKFCPIGVAEKGQSIVRVRVKGRGGHGSIPDPENAAFRLGRLLKALEPSNARLTVTEPARAFFESLSSGVGGAQGVALKGLCHPVSARAVLGALPAHLAQPLRALLTDTASPTRLKGSDAVNVIPREIVVDLDVRTLPGSGPERFFDELSGRLPDALEFETLDSSPAVVSRRDTELFAHLCRTVTRHDPACAPVPFMIPGYTDAKHFSKLGMDCYGFAPLALEPADAAELKHRVHGADERVSKEAFLKGYMILEDAVLSYIS